MIFTPDHMEEINIMIEDPVGEDLREDLLLLHETNRINNMSIIDIPDYWVSTVLQGVLRMSRRFPYLKFGSIIRYRNRLRIYTNPISREIEKMKYDLYNEIDNLILSSIDSELEKVDDTDERWLSILR